MFKRLVCRVRGHEWRNYMMMDVEEVNGWIHVGPSTGLYGEHCDRCGARHEHGRINMTVKRLIEEIGYEKIKDKEADNGEGD